MYCLNEIFCNLKEVKDAARIAIIFYNTRPPHMSINMMTPKEATTYILR